MFDAALALFGVVAEVSQVTATGSAVFLAVVAGGALVLRRSLPLAVLAISGLATALLVVVG
jgi:hypothetical protein